MQQTITLIIVIVSVGVVLYRLFRRFWHSGDCTTDNPACRGCKLKEECDKIKREECKRNDCDMREEA